MKKIKNKFLQEVTIKNLQTFSLNDYLRKKNSNIIINIEQIKILLGETKYELIKEKMNSYFKKKLNRDDIFIDFYERGIYDLNLNKIFILSDRFLDKNIKKIGIIEISMDIIKTNISEKILEGE